MSFYTLQSGFDSKLVSMLAMAPPADGAPSAFGQMLPFILIFAAMWFLLIAPQRKKQKKHDAMIKALEPGTDVVTIGGVYGTITSVKDDRFILKIADNVKIEVTKVSVANKVERT